MSGRGAHRMGTFLLSAAMVVIGVALLVQALANLGASVSPRLLLGALFIAAGGGRWYLEVRRSRGA